MLSIACVLLSFLVLLLFCEDYLMTIIMILDVHVIRFRNIIENFIINPNSGWTRRAIGDYLRWFAVPVWKMALLGDIQFWKLFSKTPEILTLMTFIYCLNSILPKNCYKECPNIRALVNIMFQLVKTLNYMACIILFSKAYSPNIVLLCFLTDLPENLALKLEYLLENIITGSPVSLKAIIDGSKLYAAVNIATIAWYRLFELEYLQDLEKAHRISVFLLLSLYSVNNLQVQYSQKPVFSYASVVFSFLKELKRKVSYTMTKTDYSEDTSVKEVICSDPAASKSTSTCSTNSQSSTDDLSGKTRHIFKKAKIE